MVIQFDIPEIPADATIKSAELSLYTYGVNSGTSTTLKNGPKTLYKNTANWSENSVNWSNKPAYATTAVATNNTSSTQTWEDFDVTEVIQDIVENGANNYGFTLRHTSYNYGIKMRSSEYSTSTNRPKLTIVYEDNTAPEVTVLTPGIGDIFNPGDQTEITWNATDTRDVVSRAISFSSDNGATWDLVDEAQGNTGTYDWTVPDEISANCQIKVDATDAAGNVGSNVSGVFAIEPPSSIIPFGFNIIPADKYNVKIVNIQGREIASFETKDLRHINKMMKSLSSGVHIIHITTPNQKFSKQIRVVR